ncbi:MAG: phosphoribosyltransferase family protein [Planctomycetota bacterium]
MHADIDRKLFTEEAIVEGIDRVAKEVTRYYQGRDLTVISVLKGSCIFAADLIRRIPIPLELGFCAASSYGDGTTSGQLKVNFAKRAKVVGRNLLLVDDILDTGKTMYALKQEFLARGARGCAPASSSTSPPRRASSSRLTSGCSGRGPLRGGVRPGLRGPLPQPAFVGSLKPRSTRPSRAPTGAGGPHGPVLSRSEEQVGLELDEFLCLLYPGVSKGSCAKPSAMGTSRWWARRRSAVGTFDSRT